MIIPVQPVPVRISLEAQAITNGGYLTTDIDIVKMIREAESVQYELNLCNGTMVLYRSVMYSVNKNLNTVTFFLMVGSDLFSATLSASNKRCTFAKIDMGLSEGTVSNMINNAIENLRISGYSDALVDVDDEDGCTLTTPYAATDITAYGHLYIHTASDDYESDFAYTPSGFKLAKGTSSSVTGDIVISDQADISVTPPVKTGIYIQDAAFENLNVFVTWYDNPDGCYLATGQFTPASGG